MPETGREDTPLCLTSSPTAATTSSTTSGDQPLRDPHRLLPHRPIAVGIARRDPHIVVTVGGHGGIARRGRRVAINLERTGIGRGKVAVQGPLPAPLGDHSLPRPDRVSVAVNAVPVWGEVEGRRTVPKDILDRDGHIQPPGQ